MALGREGGEDELYILPSCVIEPTISNFELDGLKNSNLYINSGFVYNP